MNPIDFVTHLSKYKNNNKKKKIDINIGKCEVIALSIFISIYIIIRLFENYIIPLIPEFFTTEISALFKWSPILVPIGFGLYYMIKLNRRKLQTTKSNR